jgi:hydrogenase maturation protein HypF
VTIPVSVEIRVRGRVQGVGFRPTVWRYARELGLRGEVRNDAAGVVILVSGSAAAVDRLIERLHAEPPPLASIQQIERRPIAPLPMTGFRIAPSDRGVVQTEVAPDAVTCADCAAEIVDPLQRRFRYAFTNCTHCGPRLSIIRGIPYDRANTTMARFALCADCRREHADPADRRFHAEAIACHACGPKLRLLRLDGRATSFDLHSMLDDADAAGSLIWKGQVVALKGIGGYQLACDATNEAAVRRLRLAKSRETKPFALMARDLAVIRRYCTVTAAEHRQLTSPEGPIVLMRADGAERLPDAVAPDLHLLGFMLPTTPLHLLVLRRLDRPVVMTSGNPGDEPQITDDAEALHRLAGIAEYALVHDREIALRVDDSVLRVVDDAPRMMRRARGFAPTPIALPPGFEAAPAVLAYGGELKSTFCLLTDGKAILSQHIGDLENAPTFDDFQRNLALYAKLFDHAPRVLAADSHPEYRAARLARRRADAEGLHLVEVQHHHAHLAACLAENAWPLDAPPVLGVVLDGLGWGTDDTIWGGEFLLADYRGFERLGTIKPVAMLGGDKASQEPWRNLYAHLMAEMGWPAFAMNFAELELYRYLEQKPRAALDGMLRSGIAAPLASSCGRLFDAVAAALDLCREHQGHEAEAASRLEAITCETTLRDEDAALAYPFAIPRLHRTGLPYIEPLAMWNAVLGDLILRTPAPVIAARFHKFLANAIAAMVRRLAQRGGEQPPRFTTVALTGGCMQNAVLYTETARRLAADGFAVLAHSRVPANDGGIAVGQAVIAAARSLGSDR